MTRQLRRSLLNYMDSPILCPDVPVREEELDKILVAQ